MNTEADNSHAGQQPQHLAGADADVLAQVSDIENQFQSFKELLRKQAIMQLEIRRQQVELKERDAQARERESALESKCQEAASLARQLESQRTLLNAGQQEIEARSMALREQLETLEAKKVELDAKVQEHRAEVLRDLSALEEEEGRIVSQREEAASETEALETQRSELHQQAVELERHLADYHASCETLRQRLEEVLQREVGLTAQFHQLAHEREALARETADLARARGDLGADEERIKRAMEMLAEQRGELARSLAALEHAAQAREQGWREREQQLLTREQALAASAGVDADLAAMLREVIDEYEQLWLLELRRPEGVQGQCTEQRTSAEAAEEIAELESVIEALKETIRASQRQQHEMAAEHLAKVAALEAEIERAQAQRGETAQSAWSMSAEPPPMTADGGMSIAEAAAQASRRLPWMGEEQLRSRRRRLKLYRELVRRQAIKIRKASEALKKRFEQVEQLMSQRADLAAARLKIIEAQNREQRRSGVSRTLVSLLCFVVIVAMLGGLSWAVSREIAPARFAATAIIKAQSKERELTSGELTEWQSLHESLLTDPRLHEALAERYKRQGVLSLSSAPEVAEMATTRVSCESGSAGELKVRMEGQGMEATSRSLEIFINGLVSYINSGNVRRVDGALTVVAQPAAAISEPLDTVRMQYALAMSGAALIVLLGLGSVIWRRLATAKSQFELDSHLAATLNAEANIIPDRD